MARITGSWIGKTWIAKLRWTTFWKVANITAISMAHIWIRSAMSSNKVSLQRFVQKEPEDRRELTEWGWFDAIAVKYDFFSSKHIQINCFNQTSISGKMCVLDCAPSALKMLHNSTEFMPYVIFIAAPGMEQLKNLYSERRVTGGSQRNLAVCFIGRK